MRLRGGKEKIRRVTTKVPWANAYYTNKRLRIDHCDGVALGRVLERGVVLVHNGETGIYAECEDIFVAVSSQTHASSRYGIDMGVELAGELARLADLISEATEIHSLALQYADLGRKAFEQSLTGASTIFADLKMSRDSEKTHARDRAAIVHRLVTRGNPGATAATALGLLGNLQRRSLKVSETLGPGVANRALALIELKNKWIKDLKGLMTALISLEKHIRTRVDQWNDGKALGQRKGAAAKIKKLIAKWFDQNAPSPFNAIVGRSLNNLMHAERYLVTGKHGQAHRAVLSILEDLERTFLLDEIEAARYWILRYQTVDPDHLCRQVSHLIAIARHLYEFNVTDHLKMPGVLDTLFEALFYASHGEADKVRDVLKDAARQLN